MYNEDSSNSLEPILTDTTNEFEDLPSITNTRKLITLSSIRTTDHGTTDYNSPQNTIGTNPISLNKKIDITNVFVVKFPSERIEVCYTTDSILYEQLEVGKHIIIEADRGYDCAIISLIIHEDVYKKLFDISCEYSIEECLRLVDMEIAPRRILRLAYSEDISYLVLKREREELAFEKCRRGILEYNHEMTLLFAEYQWDMQKLTFYFSTHQSVDFRELVHDLYRFFKVRIWMCSMRKSKNRCLKVLFEDQ